jgi:hypothetical protein
LVVDMALITQAATDKRQMVVQVAVAVALIRIQQGGQELLGKEMLVEMVQARLAIMVLAVAVQGQ